LKNFTSNRFARIISTIFVPPSFTIIIFAIFAFTLEVELSKKLFTFLIPFVLGFLLPIALFLYLRTRGKLIDQDASIKEERTFPFLVAIVFYLIGLLLMIKFNLNIISIAFWFCYISITVITIFINKYWKISAHSMGVSGPFAVLIFVFGWIGLILLPVVLLVGWSRVKLKCHSIAQVMTGIVVAFVSVYIQMYYITKYYIN